MTNVLPPQEKKRLWAFHRRRFVLVGSSAFSVAALISLIGISPSYIALELNRAVVEEALAHESQPGEERVEAFKTQAIIKELQPFIDVKQAAVDLIAEALQKKPAGITITRIAYSKEAQDRIILTGSASAREQVNVYRKALEQSEVFASVTVPVGDLVGAAGKHFTITLLAK